MESNKELTKQEIIEKHKSVVVRGTQQGRFTGYNFTYLSLHSAEIAMDEYASQWKSKYDELARWKKEAELILNPILDYGQKHPDIKLGQSITTFVVDRCKKYDELKAENAALKASNDLLEQGLYQHKEVNTALKENADKMRDCLYAVLIIHSAFPLHDSELIEDINDALSTYSENKDGKP